MKSTLGSALGAGLTGEPFSNIVATIPTQRGISNSYLS